MKLSTQHFQSRQHMVRGEYELFHYSDKKMDDVQLHHHDFYEVYLFLSGNVIYSIEGRTYILRPNDILLIGPNELHQAVIDTALKPYERMVLWINPQFLHQLGDELTNLADCFDPARHHHTNLLRLAPERFQQLKNEFQQLYAETYDKGYGSSLLCASHIQRLMVMINRSLLHEVSEDMNEDVITDPFLEPVVTYIAKNLESELTLDQIAKQMYLSKFHIMREFKKQTGTTIHHYILQKRLALSKQLILEGIPITEVFTRCGFKTYSHFFRAFKTEYEMTPKEFYRWMHG